MPALTFTETLAVEAVLSGFGKSLREEYQQLPNGFALQLRGHDGRRV